MQTTITYEYMHINCSHCGYQYNKKCNDPTDRFYKMVQRLHAKKCAGYAAGLKHAKKNGYEFMDGSTTIKHDGSSGACGEAQKVLNSRTDRKPITMGTTNHIKCTDLYTDKTLKKLAGEWSGSFLLQTGDKPNQN